MPDIYESEDGGHSGGEYIERFEELHQALIRKWAVTKNTADERSKEAAEGEFQLCIDFRLGSNLSPPKRERLVELHRTMIRGRLDATNALRAGQLEPTTCAECIRALAKSFATNCEQVLSEDEYTALFHARPGEVPELASDPGTVKE
jgi:hypothetical protein